MNKLWITLCFLLPLAGLHAQETYNSSGQSNYHSRYDRNKKKGFDPQRIIVGGGVGVSLGDYTDLSISPIVGYKFTDHFAAGISLGYDYQRIKDFFYLGSISAYSSNGYYDLKGHSFSTGAWARYLVWRNFFVQAGFEENYLTFTDYEYDQAGSGNIVPFKEHYNAPSLLIGPGYRLQVGERASITLAALYDVIQDKYSPYYGGIYPVIQFNVGF